MSDRELMQQALEKLEFFAHMKGVSEDTTRLITRLRERLAQPEQESVKFNCIVVDDAHPEGVPLSQWYGLTDQEINSVRYTRDWTAPWSDTTFARAIEEKLKEKNHG
jgi:S-adenosylhomocysteine hydrolase